MSDKYAMILQREERKRKRKAVRLALEALGQMLQKIAFDASMVEVYGQENYLHGKRCSEKKAEIRDAQEVLRGMLDADADHGQILGVARGENE